MFSNPNSLPIFKPPATTYLVGKEITPIQTSWVNQIAALGIHSQAQLRHRLILPSAVVTRLRTAYEDGPVRRLATMFRSLYLTPTSFESCWPFQGVVRKDGYGLAMRPTGQRTPANRLTFELLGGPEIAAWMASEGFQVDHICHTRACEPGGDACMHRRCVNPLHLALAYPSENVARAQSPYCRPQGHPLTEGNLYVHTNKDGVTRRHCRACRAEHDRRHKAKKRGMR